MNLKKESFDKLVKKMESLKETEQGKFRGGISVLSCSNKHVLGTNSGVCVNNGDCSKELNSGECFNYPANS